MPPNIEFLPDDAERRRPLFANDEEYSEFRKEFAEQVSPQQQEWLEARRRSEEKARERFIR
jgi:hypothetical protein